jgi:hypothetical protein
MDGAVGNVLLIVSVTDAGAVELPLNAVKSLRG